MLWPSKESKYQNHKQQQLKDKLNLIKIKNFSTSSASIECENKVHRGVENIWKSYI